MDKDKARLSSEDLGPDGFPIERNEGDLFEQDGMLYRYVDGEWKIWRENGSGR